MSEVEFYDVEDQTKYKITVRRPEHIETLSELFISQEELAELLGHSPYLYGHEPRTYVLNGVVSKALCKWAEKLDASGKKTLPIEDAELLDILQDNYVSDFMDDRQYGRHGNRICYSSRYKRKKTKPSKSDVRTLWLLFEHAFQKKYGCWPPYVATYNRHLQMFKAFKDIVGWRKVRSCIGEHDNVKFLRQIWDNPEEYL